MISRAFDFSLVPPACNGVWIAQAFCGLHSENLVDLAWTARSHIVYGVGYTKGLHTLVVGDPPLTRPQYDVSDLPLKSWILALGMLLAGTEDRSVRLIDLIISGACLFPVLLLLRQLYGDILSLLAGLLLVLLPLSGYFGFEPVMVLLGLWGLYRYLQLMGRLDGGAEHQRRHLIELGIALFLLVQWNWVGIFYAFVIGMHFVVSALVQRRGAWQVFGVVALASTLGLSVNFFFMIEGFRNNIAVETAAKESPAGMKLNRGKGVAPLVVNFEAPRDETVWTMMKTLYRQEAGESELRSFSWVAWMKKNLEFAATNFSFPVLLLLVAYLLYLMAARFCVLYQKAVGPFKGDALRSLFGTQRPFAHMWFFLFPGLLFLFTFKGLFWKHQYWQSSFALFVAIGAAQGLLLTGDQFNKVHRWFGRSVVAALVLIIVVFCNHGLASYRAIRWHSPRTLALFKQLNHQIPGDKALLTFKDFMRQQNRAKVAAYVDEYAWYLDREMIVANAWIYDMYWAKAARIDEVASKTIHEIQQQAATGRFPYYMIPARDPSSQDRARDESQREPPCAVILKTDGSAGQIRTDVNGGGPGTDLASLSAEKLERMLNDKDWQDDETLYWEKHRRYREAVIARLKGLYPCEYYGNNAVPGEEDYCYSGDTPCLLFDLAHPIAARETPQTDSSAEPVRSKTRGPTS